MKDLTFHVGPIPYRVVVSDRSIFNEDGCQLEGQAVESHRLLLLSVTLHPQRREEVALHELAHAYEFHFPAPGDAEERSQLFGIAAKQFRIDLEAQGGAERFLELIPRRVPHLGKPVAKLPCPLCAEKFFDLDGLRRHLHDHRRAVEAASEVFGGLLAITNAILQTCSSVEPETAPARLRLVGLDGLDD